MAGSLREVGRTLQGALTAPEKWGYAWGLTDPEALCLPQFLGIGAQKAGTSWLWENLRCHPELYLPATKELHYFDRKFHHSLAYYASRFTPGRDRVRGEITPAYGSLPTERVQLIGKLMPRLRIVFMMRDPIERAWSHAKMHLLERTGPRTLEEVSEAEFLAHFRATDSREKGDYLSILENWARIFPEEQIFTGFFEDIRVRPEALLCEVFRHLRVSTDVDWSVFPVREVVYEGRKNPIPPHYRQALEEIYLPEIERLRARFGDRVSGWGARGRA